MSDCGHLIPDFSGQGIVPTLSDECARHLRPHSKCIKHEVEAIECEAYERRTVTIRPNDTRIDLYDATHDSYTLSATVVGLEGSDAVEYSLYLYPDVSGEGEYEIRVNAEPIQGDYNVVTETGTATVYGGLSPTCFISGTKVWTPDGTKNIEDIEIGDTILAWNDLTEEVIETKVLNTIAEVVTSVYRISVGKDTLEVTGKHRMYLPSEERYEAVENLTAGDELLDVNGNTVRIKAIGQTEGVYEVHNIEVDTYSNYFVGERGLLSYNMNIPDANGISTIKLSPKSLRSVGNGQVEVSIWAEQSLQGRGTLPITTFNYGIAKSGSAPDIQGSSGNTYPFSLTGSEQKELRLTLLPTEVGVFHYQIQKTSSVPSNYHYGGEQYILGVDIEQANGEFVLKRAIIQEPNSTKKNNLSFSWIYDDRQPV